MSKIYNFLFGQKIQSIDNAELSNGLQNLKNFVGLKEICFQEFCEKHENIVIYGAEAPGRRIYTYLKNLGIPIYAICDNELCKKMNLLNDTPIISSETLKLVANQNLDLGIIISVDTNLTDNIKKHLRFKVGIPEVNIYTFDKIDNVCLGERSAYCSWNYNLYEMVDNLNKIKQMFSILADEESKNGVLAMLKHRMTYNSGYLGISPWIDLNAHFFPEHIYGTKNSDEIIVDGGAYDGDFLKILSDYKINFKKIYLFEPDKKNFDKLEQAITDFGFRDKSTTFEKGLSDSDKNIHFVEGRGAGSFLTDEETKTSIECVALDNVSFDEKVTYLKLNIEGAEYDALIGAKNMLRELEPKLMISNHHLTSHLWEVPLLIKEINPAYKIYYRQHGGGTWSIFLYATVD